MRLVILLSVALLTGASRANAAHPTTYVYVLLGGFAGADGYMDSSGMLLLARRIAWIPHTWVESYNWADWVTAAKPHLGAANEGYQGSRDRILRRRIAGKLVGEQHPAQEDRPGRDL